jgi:hypothetical protein
MRDLTPCREAVSQSRNIATAAFAGVMGGSFKIEKRRNRCPMISLR